MGTTSPADISTRQDLEEQVEEKITKSKPGRKLFGTFGGVFVPTLLTILGVIMYLREGWVVGNAGLLGAFLIILLSFGITAFTGLALSSITTNIRIGAGGAFNVISQALGVEVGGSIGVPLYISQALAVVMYIFGFRAGWNWVFPDHPGLMVDLAAFAVLFAIAYVSASLAFKVQYVILAVIIGSLVSVGLSISGATFDQPITWWGDFAGSKENGFSGIGFWAVFAVFFPASTGIMAGANMSGDLKNPRRSIPLGTMSAILLSLLIYLALAWWLAASASTEELLNNYTIMIEKAAWGPAVLAGLLGATFSSALSSLVGAPRILQALAQHKILPASRILAQRTESGEPRNALLLTGAIVLGGLMLRDLNAVAPLITMFFLLTYLMINAVVVIEQGLGLVSFRPLMRIPRLIPVLGGAGCLFAMAIVSPLFSLVALIAVVVIHTYLVKKQLEAPYSDMRSGLFTAMAEWAAKRAAEVAASRERTWKANLVIPVEEPDKAGAFVEFWLDLAKPKGFVRLLGLADRKTESALERGMADLADRIKEDDVFANWTVVQAAAFHENLAASLEALGSAFITSNILFLRLPEDDSRDSEFQILIENAVKHEMAVVLYIGGEPVKEDAGSVAVWLDPPRDGWRLGKNLGNMDLALLVGYKVSLNREVSLEVTVCLGDESERDQAKDFIEAVLEMARMPEAGQHTVNKGSEETLIDELKPSLCVFPMGPEPDFEALRKLPERMECPCLLSLDSGKENVLA
jgi:solute carrier family 12 sodium/potassium/chloride transporter 2